ncbi:MAG TPA: hypothetical protein ENN65_00795 [Candidatus Hydrogenedentes bacterium]|nr:hypothetical protein [Candidatus Hydrogenedentota bacterium]
MTDAWLHIGTVVAVDAARRRLRIRVAARCEREFDGRDRVWLDSGAGTPVQARTANVRQTGANMTVELTPGVSRDMVAGFRNATVMIPAAASVRTADDRAGLHDLTGMRVLTEDGRLLGAVAETLDTPGGGVMRLRRADGVTATAPVTGAFIVDIALEAGSIVVKEPEFFLVFDEANRDEKPPRDAAQDGL